MFGQWTFGKAFGLICAIAVIVAVILPALFGQPAH